MTTTKVQGGGARCRRKATHLSIPSTSLTGQQGRVVPVAGFEPAILERNRIPDPERLPSFATPAST